MPRRTADVRHTDSTPESAVTVIDQVLAFHHPTRRRLFEVLWTNGPASVGRLTELTGLAPGSISHHLKPLHRVGAIEPAQELARDTRESWWRAIPRSLSWSADDYAEGTAAREIAKTAERANLEYQDVATADWLRTRYTLPTRWRRVSMIADRLVNATPTQTADLEQRLLHVLETWGDECVADEARRPAGPRRPVRILLRVFPTELGRRA